MPTVIKYFQLERRVSEGKGSFNPAVLAPPEQGLYQTNERCFQRVLHDLHCLRCVTWLDIAVGGGTLVRKYFELKYESEIP